MMKNSSKLLLCLLAGSSLIGCSTNSQTGVIKPEAPNNMVAKASTLSDMVQANTAEQYHEMGRMYHRKGNLEMATIAYQKALKLDPSLTKSMTALASILAEQEILVMAIPLFEKVVSLEPSAQHYNNLGYAYYMNKQYAEAERVLNQALMIDSTHTQANRNLELVALNISAEKNAADNNNEAHVVVINEVKSTYVDTEALTIAPLKLDATENQVQTTNQLIQIESNVYVLDTPNPKIDTTKQDTVKSVKPQTEVTTNQKPKTVFKPDLPINVVSSGGIHFQHASTISKIFHANNAIIDLSALSTDATKVIEVINGNGVKGIARAFANHLTTLGIKQVSVADAKRFNHFKTHIQYKSGFRENAVTLNHNMANRPIIIRNDKLPENVSMRLVLGRDLKS